MVRSSEMTRQISIALETMQLTKVHARVLSFKPRDINVGHSSFFLHL